MTPRRRSALLLAGDGLSAFGSWIDFLAILTLSAWQFQVTPWQMALVSAAGLLPGMLAAPRIGRLCDRADPRRLLLLSLLGRAGATAAILSTHAFLPFLGWVAMRSVCATVAPLAINVMAVRTLAAERLPRFFALLNVLNNSAKVLAPALGTVSSSLASEALALSMSLSFSAAAFLVFACAGPTPPPAGQPGHDAGPAATPRATLVPLLWVAASAAFFVFMANNLVPLALQRSGLDKALLGILVGSSGAGNILSGLWLARRGAAKPPGGTLRELQRPALLQALGFGAIGAVLWRWPAAAAGLLPLLFFLIGTASARYAVALNTHLSAHFASRMGRVSGVLQSWQNGTILLAPMLGAVVLDALGPAALFGLASVIAPVSFGLLRALQAAGGPRLRGPG